MNARVVVIDDEAPVCELLGKVLNRAGYEVLPAGTGEAGLSLLEQHHVTCVMVDKRLPQMGGLEVVATVRQRWPRVGIVLMTAHPQPFNLATERPDVVLAKPFKNLSVVEHAVREAIDAHAVKNPLYTFKERVAAVMAEMTPGRRKRE